jgi:SAM-dependent methyltransferase
MTARKPLLAGSITLLLTLMFFPTVRGQDDVGMIVYVPTPQVVVDKMLDMVKCKGTDVVFDLGCGDGRIVATAAKKFGAEGIGIDIDPDRIKDSKATMQKFGVKEGKGKGMVDIRQGNALKVPDLDRATVVTLYMLPEFMEKLEPIAKKTLKPGTRIVAHDFSFHNWKPDQTIEFKGPEREHTLYLWIVKGDQKDVKKDKDNK